MKRRRKLPPDTRPKWNDPKLPGAMGMSSNETERWARDRLKSYDYLPRTKRDEWKNSLSNRIDA